MSDEFDPELLAELKRAPRRDALRAIAEAALDADAFDTAINAIAELKRISLNTAGAPNE